MKIFKSFFKKDKYKLHNNLKGTRGRNIMIILALIICIFLIFLMFNFNDQESSSEFKLIKPPKSNSNIIKVDKTSSEYLQAILEESKTKSKEAIHDGNSLVPMLIDSSSDFKDIDKNYKNNLDYTQDCYNVCPPQNSDNLVDYLNKHDMLSTTSAKELQKLRNANVPPSDYANFLNKLVKKGELNRDQAAQLFDTYNKEHKEHKLQNVNDFINKMEATGEISSNVADKLRHLSKQAISKADYVKAINQMVKEGLLTRAQANKLINSYKTKKVQEDPIKKQSKGQEIPKVTVASDSLSGINQVAKNRIDSLEESGLSANRYADKLMDMVKTGQLTPAQAKKLLENYIAENGLSNIVSSDKLSKTNKKYEEQSVRDKLDQLASMSVQEKQEEIQKSIQIKQSILAANKAAISQQMQNIISTWNSVEVQQMNYILTEEDKIAENKKTTDSGSINQFPLIKAGSIIFAVLNTKINSDAPAPVLATITFGKFKGAKLLGNLTMTSDKEAVMLQFNSMTMNNWHNTIKINSVAVDPDTDQLSFASSVNTHIFTRYGSLIAASFLSGYANYLSKAKTYTMVDSDGTLNKIQEIKDKITGEDKKDEKDEKEQNNNTEIISEFRPKEAIMAGLGESGSTVSKNLEKNINRLPTVKVDSGIALGILFMNDVIEQPIVF